MFVIEIPDGSYTNPGWIRCETDGTLYRAETREEAEAEARFTFGDIGEDGYTADGTEWRVVEVCRAKV